MATNLSLKLNQKLKVFLRSPLFQMQARLLRSSKSDIENVLKEIGEANPFLEWKKTNNNFISLPPQDKESREEIIEKTASRAETKQKILMSIYAETQDERERNIATYIISSLNSKGLLKISAIEIAKDLKEEVSKVERVWKNVKRTFADGTAAANIQEALAIQAEARGWKLEKKIIQEAFSDFKRLRIEKIAKRIGISKTKVTQAIRNIKTLTPYPRRRWEKDIAVIPEFKLVKKENTFCLQDPYPLQLGITCYKIRGRDKEKRSFIEEKLRQAKILIEAMKKREETLKKITEFLIQEQKGYLLGRSERKDITLDDISKKLGIDKTIISRALNNKYIEYQGQLFKLSHLIVHKKQKDKSYSQARRIIQESIEKENKFRPLSDKELQNILKQRGIHLQRRLVTKYRLKLGIPSSFMRKRIAALKQK